MQIVQFLFTGIGDNDGAKSISDIQSITIEMDSVEGSPEMTRVRICLRNLF